ncbi:Cullin-3 [Hypsizygus marmoreus]|uniref:Cullin-3 n=1 Tax=Hypsizygus marmoreus TaxID=39966 RepID=A0A369K2H3_HYPMA|nr:Cullin-3 [Hypsizygus marmoreus]
MASTARRGKTKIKPPRKHGQAFSAEKTWAELANNIREIQNHDASNLSFEENYRFAYNMVLHKEGRMLYEGVKKLVAENLDMMAREKVIPAFPTGSINDPMHESQEGDIFLKALRGVWDDHVSNMIKLGQILKYMDRVHTKTDKVPEIWDAGLHLFLKHIIRPPIQQHIVSAVLNQIQFERDGYSINRFPVKGCVDVLLSLDIDDAGVTVYKRDLEPAFLRESEAFYKAEGVKLLESCDAPEFLRRVESRFESEDSRTHHYLSSQTAPPLRQILQDNLLTPHLSTVISFPNSGLDNMIDTEKTDDLARLYRLFVMVPIGLPCLKKSLKDSIARRGTEINRTSLGNDGGDLDIGEDAGSLKRKGKGKARPAGGGGAEKLTLALKWVQDVLDLRDKFVAVWQMAFNSDREVESALNEAFESFVNSNDKAPEFISLFIDDNLKKGLKGKTDSEVEAVLDKTITVFRFLTDKDVFERYYKGHLAKRLLQGRSVSDDAERGMLAKLKVECGYQFTQKLEGMFHDMKLSGDTMQAYRAHLAKTTPPSIDLSVTVVTQTFWPMSHSPSPCVLSAEMEKACKSFEQFYLSRHSGRRLTWQPSLGNADVRVAFKAKTIELNVSTFALIILLQFQDLEDDGFLTFTELQEATRIDDNDLQRHLQSLACAKYKVLKKHPPGREVERDDSFSFNADFTSTLLKIKIGTISSKVESGEERKETRDRIDEERRHQTEACIVRIMKDRKHMKHNDLINEVTRQLSGRFQPDPLNIKKRIEGLIEREYLERCPDRKSYNYSA